MLKFVLDQTHDDVARLTNQKKVGMKSLLRVDTFFFIGGKTNL